VLCVLTLRCTVTFPGDDGGEEQNDEEDAEEEEDGDGLDDVLRDSDLLSDDDEQLRIAMALSLSSLRREQKQQQAQRSEQPAPLPQQGAARSSAEAGLEVDASGKCSRSGVKCADSRPALGKCDCGHYTVVGC
jgi:hypothetical protein